MKAMNTKSIAAILAANFNPSDVPTEIASKKFEPILSCETSIFELIFSVSG